MAVYRPLTTLISKVRASHLCPKRYIHVSTATRSWHEHDHKGGYDTFEPHPFKHMVKEGWQMLPDELRKLKEEWITKLRCDSCVPLEHGDYQIQWMFDNKEAIDDWKLTTDKDHLEGSSQAEFFLSKQKTGIFKGKICTQPPKDGRIKYAGYCNVKSPANYRSFKRAEPYDWSSFTHILTRVRGDGRNYQIVLGMHRYFDIIWNDTYQYSLFTRGGPYWQIAKIPLSKFFLAGKGRIQDKQEKIQPESISFMGISAADDKDGEFNLEMDYIALIYDSSHREEFAYEQYTVPAYKIG